MSSQQARGGGSAPADDVGADRGQRRLQVGGDLGVVVAGDRQPSRARRGRGDWASDMPAIAIRSLA
ncbi:MAG: hypothetical protein WKF76_06145 [Nocardioidaceae bacterium]